MHSTDLIRNYQHCVAQLLRYHRKCNKRICLICWCTSMLRNDTVDAASDDNLVIGENVIDS